MPSILELLLEPQPVDSRAFLIRKVMTQYGLFSEMGVDPDGIEDADDVHGLPDAEKFYKQHIYARTKDNMPLVAHVQPVRGVNIEVGRHNIGATASNLATHLFMMRHMNYLEYCALARAATNDALRTYVGQKQAADFLDHVGSEYADGDNFYAAYSEMIDAAVAGDTDFIIPTAFTMPTTQLSVLQKLHAVSNINYRVLRRHIADFNAGGTATIIDVMRDVNFFRDQSVNIDQKAFAAEFDLNANLSMPPFGRI